MRILWLSSLDDCSSFFLFLKAIIPCDEAQWDISNFGFGVCEYFVHNEPEDGKVLLIVDASQDDYQSVIARATEVFGLQNIVVVALVSPEKPPLKRLADLTIRSILIDHLNGTDESIQIAAQIEELFCKKGLQRPVVHEDSAIPLDQVIAMTEWMLPVT